MAKKPKKQKAGMLKRKKQKQAKKALNRRQSASRMSQKRSSERELQKLLARLPILAYEPEFQNLYFEERAFRAQQAQDIQEPHLIKNLITPEFLATVQEGLEQMDPRTSGEVQKNIMVKGMLYTLEHQDIPHFINPLIVAIYLRSKAKYEGQPLALSQILKAVKAYETEHMETIEALIEAVKTENDAPSEEAPLPAPATPSPIEEALLEAYHHTLSSLEEETAERIREDIEVFLEDYITQPLEEWNAQLLDTFLGSWFIKNLNPMLNDLISMQNSLEHFFQFLETQNKIAPEEMQKILIMLQDKETYQQRMDS